MYALGYVFQKVQTHARNGASMEDVQAVLYKR